MYASDSRLIVNIKRVNVLLHMVKGYHFTNINPLTLVCERPIVVFN